MVNNSLVIREGDLVPDGGSASPEFVTPDDLQSAAETPGIDRKMAFKTEKNVINEAVHTSEENSQNRENETPEKTTRRDADCPLQMPTTGETTSIILEVACFPYWISFAFERVNTEISVTVYGYTGPQPPPDIVWKEQWDAEEIHYPSGADKAPLPETKN